MHRLSRGEGGEEGRGRGEGEGVIYDGQHSKNMVFNVEFV